MTNLAFNRILDFSNGLDFNLGFFFIYIFGVLNAFRSVHTRMLSIILLALTFPLNTRSQDSIPILLSRLDQAIEASPRYDSAKLLEIARLKTHPFRHRDGRPPRFIRPLRHTLRSIQSL